MSDHVAARRAAIDFQPQRSRLEMASPMAPKDAPALRFGRASRLIFALIVALFAAVRFWKLAAYGLFSDEVFSAETVHRTWPQLQRAVINDVVHPPLFYYLLKAWIAVGDALLWMKLLPVLFALLAIVPFVLLCRELKLRPLTTNLALFLMAVNEYLVNYAQELRMYSLLLLLVMTSMWLFARLMNARHRAFALQLALLATNLILVYAHYYGWLIVAAESLFVIIKRRDLLASFSLSVAALVAGFLPWMFAVAEVAYDKGGLGPNLKWNTRPTATDFFQHYVTLNGPVYTSWRAYALVFSSAIFFTPLLLWSWRQLKKAKYGVGCADARGGKSNTEANRVNDSDSNVLLWLALLALLPTGIAFAASYLLAQSVWGSRFLIVVAPAYLLLVAIAVTTLQPRRLRHFTIALIALWAALSGALQLTHRDKINWQPLVERMAQQEIGQGPVPVYTRQGVTGTTIQYYLDQASEARLRVQYIDDYSRIDDTQFWIAFIRYRHDTGPSPTETLAARGDTLGEAIEADAPGHKVIFIPVRHGSR
ncbi:MAG: hypothetical protein ACJ74G_18700 [Blastocatellia bacterium]